MALSPGADHVLSEDFGACFEMVKRGERKIGSLGCPALITNMPNRGSPPIGPRYRSCPQLQLTIIDCLRPTRGYPITRRRDESQRLSLFALYSFSSTITSSSVCPTV
jgi:hypothetical protein